MPIKPEDRITRSFRLLEFMLAQTNTYHNHKETMANAGMIAQLSVAAGVISIAEWPPDWMPYFRSDVFCVSREAFSLLAFLAVWTLINTFIRWQLRNRRWAAIFCAALEETLRKWANSDPEPTDLDPYPEAESNSDSRIATFVDTYLFPWRTATLYSDVSRNGWPTALGVEWLKKAKAYRNEPVPAEWLLSLGSLLALLVGLAKLSYA